LTNSLITDAQNSFQLSDWRITGGELREWKSSNKYAATSTAHLDVSALA